MNESEATTASPPRGPKMIHWINVEGAMQLPDGTCDEYPAVAPPTIAVPPSTTDAAATHQPGSTAAAAAPADCEPSAEQPLDDEPTTIEHTEREGEGLVESGEKDQVGNKDGGGSINVDAPPPVVSIAADAPTEPSTAEYCREFVARAQDAAAVSASVAAYSLRDESSSGTASAKSPKDGSRRAAPRAAAAAVHSPPPDVIEGISRHQCDSANDDIVDRTVVEEVRRAAKVLLQLPTAEKLIEEDLEGKRFRAECWLEKIYLALAARSFEGEQRRLDALRGIKAVLSPYCLRRVATWQRSASRAAAAAARRNLFRPLTPQALKATNTYFVDWPVPVLEELLSTVEFETYSAGEFVFYEGDRSRNMYIIAQGQVDIIVRTGSNPAKPKSRAKSNGVVVATLNHNDLFGEGATLFGEPRCASALCATPTDLWVIPERNYTAIAAYQLPVIMNQRFRRLFDDKRRSNIAVVHPLRREILADHCLFKVWHVAATNDLLAAFQPQVFRQGTVLCTAGVGAQSAAMMYIVSGEVELRAESAESSDGALAQPSSSFFVLPSAKHPRTTTPHFCSTRHVVGPGETFGEVALVLHEPAQYTAVVTRGPCEAWSISFDSFSTLIRENSSCAVAAKTELNKMRAMVIPKPVELPPLVADPTLKFCLNPAALSEAWDRTSSPLIVAAGDSLFRQGDSATRSIFVMCSGTMYVNYGTEAEAAQKEFLPGRPVVEMHSEHIDPSELPEHGIVFGAVEFALRRSQFIYSVRCTSECCGWVLRRDELESLLASKYPACWAAMTGPSIPPLIMQRFTEQALETLAGVPNPPRLAGTRQRVLSPYPPADRNGKAK